MPQLKGLGFCFWTVSMVHVCLCSYTSSGCYAGSERSWSTFRRVWSDDKNRLLSGKVALLVYCHYNQRVLDRTYKNWACTDWDSFVAALEQEDPIRAPEGHAALAVPGAYAHHYSITPFLSSTWPKLCI